MSVLEEYREVTRAHCIRLVKAGRGLHAYTLHKAQQLEAEDKRVHSGLVELVERELGQKALVQARRDIEILLGKEGRK